MSKYITMVDADDDYLQHGKFIAKVKGLGGKVRYFYNTNEYMAFLKGGKNGYNAQKKTNAMNEAMNKSGKSHATDESQKAKERAKSPHQMSTYEKRSAEAVYGLQYNKRDKAFNETGSASRASRDYKTASSTEKHFSTPNLGKMKDDISKKGKAADAAKEQRSKYVTNRMNEAADKRALTKGYKKVEDAPVKNVYKYEETGPAADAKAKAKKSAEARAEAYSKQLTKRMNDNAQTRSGGYQKIGTNEDGTDKYWPGPATDARERQKTLEKRMAEVNEPARINKLNDTMNKGIDQQGRDVEGAVRRDEYDKRVAGVEHKPPVYKPSTYEKMHKKYVNERNEQAEKNRDTRAGVGQLTGPDVLNNRGVAADEATKTWERQQMTEAKKKEAKKKKYVK